MKISIITPTYNSMPFLPGSALSVSQQETPDKTTIQHVIMDGESSDGTVEWLKEYANSNTDKSNYNLAFTSEPDKGMYNALNKAYSASNGEIIGHLNSDEQYLPGTLKYVANYFSSHPDVDILFGAVVVVDSDGQYVCSRMPIKPQLLHTQVCHLCTFTASMFYRRSAIEKLGVYFDESYKITGDVDLVYRMLNAGFKMKTDSRYFTVFIDSGDNLSFSEEAKKEGTKLGKSAPQWAKISKRLIELHYRLRKLYHGAYLLKPLEYQFIKPDGNQSKHVEENPTGRWTSRL